MSRILQRHGTSHLASYDAMTGEVNRASKTTAIRNQRSLPGELLHVDAKKIGRIPDGGGWRVPARVDRLVELEHETLWQ